MNGIAEAPRLGTSSQQDKDGNCNPFDLEMNDFPDPTEKMFEVLEKLVPDFGKEIPEVVRAGNAQITMMKRAHRARFLADKFQKAKFVLESQRDCGEIIFSATKDSTLALGYTMEAGDYRIICKLMTLICQTGIAYNLVMPDEELSSGVTSLKSMGQLDHALAVLEPLLRENPRLQSCSFVGIMRESRHTVQMRPSISAADSHLTKEPKLDAFQIHTPEPSSPNSMIKKALDAPAQNDRPGPPAENGGPLGWKVRSRCSHNPEEPKGAVSLDAMKVSVEVQVIEAGQQSDHVDPALEEIADELKHTVNFSSYALIRRKTLRLKLHEKGRLPLDGRYSLRVVPVNLTPSICRIEIAVLDLGRELLNTVVETIDGGTTVIEGPQIDDQILLIRLRAFILIPIVSSPQQELKGANSKNGILLSG